MKNNIITVTQFNKDQEALYLEYCAKCENNNVEPYPFGRYFNKFDYKKGFVLCGRYPIYGKTKKQLL